MKTLLRWCSSRFAVGLVLAVAALAMMAGVNPAIAAVPAFAGATVTVSALDNLMKVIYSDPLITDVISSSEIYDLFTKDMNVKSEETTGGKYVEMAHYLRLAGAVGARGETDYIPVPQQPRAANSRIYLRKILGVVEMSGDVMEKVVNDEGSFINYMERALPDTKERLTNELDRMAIGFGAGIKARVASKGADSIVVKDALGVTGYEDAWLQFQEGETIVFSATAAGTVLKNAGTAQAALVENIDETTGTLTLTVDAATLAAIAVDDFIFAGDQSGTSSQDGGVDREISGLLAGVDDGSILATYNNIARAGNRFWNSRVVDASAAPYSGELTEELLIVTDALMTTVSQAKFDVLVMSPHAPISYWQDMKTDRTLNDPLNYTGGKGRLSVMLGDRTIPFRTARRLPPQIAFGLTTSSWRRFTLNSWQWVSRQGGIWNLVTDNVGRKDAYFAFGKMYEQLACIKPRQNVRFEGLARKFTF